MSNIFHIQKGSHGGGTLVRDSGSNGGSGFFEIQVTMGEEEYTANADKTYNEIKKAIEDGLYPIVNAGTAKLPFTGFDYEGTRISFAAIVATQSNTDDIPICEYVFVTCNPDNTWSMGMSRMG